MRSQELGTFHILRYYARSSVRHNNQQGTAYRFCDDLHSALFLSLSFTGKTFRKGFKFTLWGYVCIAA